MTITIKMGIHIYARCHNVLHIGTYFHLPRIFPQSISSRFFDVVCAAVRRVGTCFFVFSAHQWYWLLHCIRKFFGNIDSPNCLSESDFNKYRELPRRACVYSSLNHLFICFDSFVRLSAMFNSISTWASRRLWNTVAGWICVKNKKSRMAQRKSIQQNWMWRFLAKSSLEIPGYTEPTISRAMLNYEFTCLVIILFDWIYFFEYIQSLSK